MHEIASDIQIHINIGMRKLNCVQMGRKFRSTRSALESSRDQKTLSKFFKLNEHEP